MTTDRPSPGTALEPIHIVLPMRTVSGGKARLGEVIDAEEREELVLGMLLHTLNVLGDWPVCRRIHLVSPDPVLSAATSAAGVDVTVHRQQGEGLNEGIRLGVSAARIEGAASLLVLPGDLPLLSVEALDELLTAADAGVVAAAGGALVAIVPSDAGGGTNALMLRPPDAIAPAFGQGSFEAHLRAAEAAGVAVQVVTHPLLGFDLDTPDDLERLDPGRFRELTALGRGAVDGVGV
jgi:2-phospho-L-lactate/phosphoenolpyruvate guanylyltransferase